MEYAVVQFSNNILPTRDITALSITPYIIISSSICMKMGQQTALD